jgi:integrase
VSKTPPKTQESLMQFESARVFLSSILRNSLKSKYTYQCGLVHLQRFLANDFPEYDIETILRPLSHNEINVYTLLDEFVSYLLTVDANLTPSSIKLYVAVIRSYLAYHDIDVVPSKFKRKVKMPKAYREDEEALDASDIRKILLSCNNRRLKTYLLLLASGGMRAIEGLAIRIKDTDFSVNPTKIHIRREYAKTRIGRDIYISDEATQCLKQWLEWKYNNVERPRTRNENDLVFTVYSTNNPLPLYVKILNEFQKLLTIVGLDERKEYVQRRRKITLHSLRRFTKSVISDQVGQDYSVWFLGHAKSPYYTKKEIDRREIYATKCMKYLTFLDYTTLEARGRSIEAKLREKDREMQAMKDKYESEIEAIRDETNQKFNQIMTMIQQNPKLVQVKPEALIGKNL